jgi:Tol biopolymer transport system component
MILFATLALLVTAGAVFPYLRYFKTPQPFASFEIEQLTESGDVTGVSISADGKMLVEVRSNGGLESVWIRNIATGKDVQILPAVSLEYGSIEFSHDENEIYFVHNDRAGSVTFNLYSVSVLGGEPQLVFPHVSRDIALSPDGLNVAYRTARATAKKCTL